MARQSPKILHVPKHKLDRMIGATLSDSLREQYGFRTARVVKGDSVKILRGEYKGVEGKVEDVITESGCLLIEGVQREKIRGGNVRVPIHSSNVMLVNPNLDDGRRSARFKGTRKPEVEDNESHPPDTKKENSPKEEAS